MLAGSLLGYIVHEKSSSSFIASFSVDMNLLTTIFLRLVQMIIAPLVFSTLVVGIAKLGDLKTVGRIGGKKALTLLQISALLNKHSGLLGVSGISNDMRAVLAAEEEGNARARLAVDVFCYRLKKYVAAYAGVLGGVDGLAFAGDRRERGAGAPAVDRRAGGPRALHSTARPTKPRARQRWRSRRPGRGRGSSSCPPTRRS